MIFAVCEFCRECSRLAKKRISYLCVFYWSFDARPQTTINSSITHAHSHGKSYFPGKGRRRACIIRYPIESMRKTTATRCVSAAPQPGRLMLLSIYRPGLVLYFCRQLFLSRHKLSLVTKQGYLERLSAASLYKKKNCILCVQISHIELGCLSV